VINWSDVSLEPEDDVAQLQRTGTADLELKGIGAGFEAANGLLDRSARRLCLRVVADLLGAVQCDGVGESTRVGPAHHEGKNTPGVGAGVRRKLECVLPVDAIIIVGKRCLT
jgi:hypothetical protein